ncbi:2-C-methyl-D-erythritol 4-phosphate cytidylyltransferase [Kineosporia sp. A_224]|uniref:2-C-methyl-D-erythritol 4-phosphate cytidylyltransferase n=1 Tax=Kineosporia sp. A_224 TaxID=1962180 RepID=UPI001E2FFF9B|nr:2-C-methyl-D-erythritol 4-phosphate cytidylyltransferase [Kineosporia sp. A_224]
MPVGHDDRLAPAGCAALRPLREVPLVRRAVGALVRSGVVDAVVVVTPPALVEPVGALVAGLTGDVPVEVLAAQENGPGLRVRAALRARRPDAASTVVVHDPLFPLAPAALVRAVVAALDGAVQETVTAVVPVRPVTDTLKRVDEDDVVTATVDREGFRMVYSPQAYRAGALVAALEAATEADLRDPGADVLPRLVQTGGGRLSSVLAPGEVFRVGTADDLVLAEAMLHVGADVDDERAPAR